MRPQRRKIQRRSKLWLTACKRLKARHYTPSASTRPNLFSASSNLLSDSLLVALNAHSDAHATADTEGGEPFLRIPPLHFIKQRGQDAST